MKDEEILEFLKIYSMNPQQKKAVFSKKLPIVVSASAGSGKTFVLTTRYIYKILKSSSHNMVNRILVLTFSKYAANEMFERIYNNILNLTKKYPKDKNLKNIKNIISKRLITTIDSFCYSILKENFKDLNISPNFKIISNFEIATLKEEILNSLFEEEFLKNKKNFQNLSDYFSLKDETELKNVILKIYEKSKTMPFPKEYILNIKKENETPNNYKQKIFKEIIENIIYKIDEIKNLLFCAKCSLKEELIIKNFKPILEKTIFEIEKLKYVIKKTKYDDILYVLQNFKFKSIPKYDVKKNPFNRTLAEEIKKSYINPAKKIMKTLKENFITKKQFLDDFKKQKKIIEKIIYITLKFYKKLEINKKRKNILEFSDLIVNTIKLTAKISQTNKLELTPLGKKIASQFSEILVDEFQDINNSQNILIKILSNSFNNVFMVGDLKQSIYGFRDSDTKIFLNHIIKNSKNEENGTLIYLNENFRSRKEITNSVNLVFSQIMSLDFGKTNYKKTEQLISKNKTKKEKEYATELHILNDVNESQKTELELKHIALTIKKMLDKKFKITENSTIRECTQKDFAILFRSGKKNMQIMCEQLEKLNINYICHNNFDFMQSYEISILVSILKIINNPLLEISFCAIALSPMFCFSNQEMLKIKIENNSENFFYCFKNSKRTKCKHMIEFLEKYIKKSTTMKLEELIEKIINSNYFLQIFPELDNNVNKTKNLEFFLQVARTYENFDDFGISGFLEHIEKINSQNEEIKVNENFNNKNAVNILTIHKSKGLEFPIVFIPLTSKKFNEQDFKSPILVDTKYNITLKHSSKKTLTRRNTLPFNAAVVSQQKNLKEEELRLLYVAMTRAKEKLILTATDDYSKYENIPIKHFKDFVLPYTYCASKNSFYDWILLSFLRKDQLNTKNSFCECDIIIKNIAMNEELKNKNFNFKINNKKNENKYKYNKFKKHIVKEKNHILTPIKLSITEIMELNNHKKFYKTNLKNPNFGKNNKLSSEQKGTILHKFLQYVNFENAEKNLELEIERLIKKEFLTKNEADSLNKKNLQNFFKSKTYKIIKNADLVERELQFICEIKSEKIFTNFENNNNNIFIQGVVDCLVEKNKKLTIIDYKTDELNSHLIKKKYISQIKYYKLAIEKCFNRKVECCLIYSTYLNKDIKI